MESPYRSFHFVVLYRALILLHAVHCHPLSFATAAVLGVIGAAANNAAAATAAAEVPPLFSSSS